MDLLKRFTIKNLKLNKKRTIVTIIGIILSVALITAVGTMFMSARASLIEYEVQTKGNFHAVFRDVDAKEINDFTLNRKVSEVFLSQNLGYSKLDGIKNEYKPYIYVRAYSKASMENLGVNITQGRLPENENEIVIPNHLDTNGGLDLELGDKIYLEVGQRQSGEDILNQNYEYIDDETLVYTVPKEYTIVGFMERPGSNIEPYSAPGYTAITYLNTDKITSGTFDVYVRYTIDGLRDYINTTANLLGVDDGLFSSVYDPEDVGSEEFMNNMEEVENTAKYDFGINSYLITLETGMTQNSTLSALMSAALVVIAVIIFTSIFCIKNSFDISITEKIKQYGMLASIGATKKQIKKNVYYEAFVLGLIGIPLGIIFGVLAAYILVKISNIMMTDFMAFDLVFSFSYLIILFSVLLGLITIFLSARSSSRKASKVSPIQAITNGENIKLKARKLKVPKIISKVFGVGGEISYKNLKRSRKKYRTTVISIIVSVVIFIAISSFIEYGFRMSSAYYTELGYNYAVYCRDYDDTVASEEERMQEEHENLQILLDISKFENIERFSIPKSTNLELEKDEKYEQQLTDFGKEVKSSIVQYSQTDPQQEIDIINVVSLGKEEYERYLKKIGGNYEDYKDGAILLDNSISYDREGKTIQGSIYKWKKGDIVSGKIDGKDFSVNIVDKTEERPMGMENMFTTNAFLIVSDELMESIGNYYVSGLYIQSNAPYELDKEIEQYMNLNEMKEDSLYIANMEESVREENAIVLVISIFLYGFIAVITLIGITNIFNTITTNMNLRRKEFAMLKSIGMTKKEFNRMIRLESIFYGIKSLIIGIPIGILLSYGIYKMFEDNMGMQYHLPVNAILIAIVFVAIVIGIIMKYSMSKINKQNIIETIRNDNI